MQTPSPHAVHHVPVTPGKLAVVQFRPHLPNGRPELGLVEGNVLRVSVLEDLHTDVKSQDVLVEQHEACRMAEQILREERLHKRNADAHAAEVKLRIERAMEYETIEPWMRCATERVDRRQVLNGAIVSGDATTIDDEGVQSGSYPTCYVLVKRGMQDDIDVRVDQIRRAR